MRFPSFEQTVPYFSLSEEAINILPVITNGDYADDINYHYFQLLHPARPCRLWGQLPVEETPPAAVHSLAEPSDCVTLCVSPSPSLSFLFSFFLLSQPPFYPFCFSRVNESKELHILSRVGQWMNEVRWKLIVERSEMSCEGIHGTDCTDLSHHPSYFISLSPPSGFFALALVTGPSLNLVALSLPLSTLPHFWHETSISAPWNMERALMNCLQVSSMYANGSRGTGSGFQEGCSRRRVVIQGGLASPNMLVNLQGLIILWCRLLWGRFVEFNIVTNKSSHTVYVTSNVHIVRFVNLWCAQKSVTWNLRWYHFTSSIIWNFSSSDSYPSTWIRWIIIKPHISHAWALYMSLRWKREKISSTI